jgi:hypothetical protein
MIVWSEASAVAVTVPVSPSDELLRSTSVMIIGGVGGGGDGVNAAPEQVALLTWGSHVPSARQ